jgi:hypothetical protein
VAWRTARLPVELALHQVPRLVGLLGAVDGLAGDRERQRVAGIEPAPPGEIYHVPVLGTFAFSTAAMRNCQSIL